MQIAIDLITAPEAADILGRSERTLRLWRAKRKNFAYYRFGRPMYRRADVEAFAGRDVTPARVYQGDLTAPELAELLRVKSDAVRIGRSRGTGPVYRKKSGSVSYPIRCVRDYLDARHVPISL